MDSCILRPMVLSLAAISVASLHAFSGENRLRVRLMNEAHVPQQMLSEALEETNRIYNRIGVEIAWSEREGSHSTVFIKVIAAPIRHIDTARSLGVTPGAPTQLRRHAWVFYEPICDRAASLAARTGTLLGAVIAHELGHLLLAGNSHQISGLMRHEWDAQQVLRAMRGQLTFNASQRALILSRVRESSFHYAD